MNVNFLASGSSRLSAPAARILQLAVLVIRLNYHNKGSIVDNMVSLAWCRIGSLEVSIDGGAADWAGGIGPVVLFCSSLNSIFGVLKQLTPSHSSATAEHPCGV